MSNTPDTPTDLLYQAGYLPCGVCKVAKPGAVDWGCTCEQDTDKLARDFLRDHR